MIFVKFQSRTFAADQTERAVHVNLGAIVAIEECKAVRANGTEEFTNIMLSSGEGVAIAQPIDEVLQVLERAVRGARQAAESNIVVPS